MAVHRDQPDVALVDALQLLQLAAAVRRSSDRQCRPIATSVLPASVSRMPRGSRSNRSTPKLSSSLRICRSIAEAATFSSRAARWIEPDRATCSR